MSKYIDADVLKEELQQKAFDNYTDEFWGTMQVIDEMPAADVEAVRKWISVDERLPDEGKKVLVYWERLDKKTNTVYGFIDIMYRTSECGWYCDGHGKLNWDAIAWMPLPNVPKL